EADRRISAQRPGSAGAPGAGAIAGPRDVLTPAILLYRTQEGEHVPSFAAPCSDAADIHECRLCAAARAHGCRAERSPESVRPDVLGARSEAYCRMAAQLPPRLISAARPRRHPARGGIAR